MNNLLDPKEFIITRKRKKYRFALFHNSPLCFELADLPPDLAPDVIEVGAGTGLFSVALAEAQPGKKILALDIKADRLQTGARLAEEKSLDAIRFLRARADQLSEAIREKSLESIWVTFPDPFPKKRAAKHRLTHPRYLRIYQSLLKAEGTLRFKTDSQALFEWSLEQLVTEGWRIDELSFDLHDSALPEIYKIKTTYETKFLHQGLKTYFVSATPSASAEPSRQ